MTTDAHQALHQKIGNKTVTAGVIGLGYVGLPLAHSMCNKGLKVVGFDTDPQKIEMLARGESYLETMPGSLIAAHVGNKLLTATCDMKRLSEPDVIVICVPTPLGEHREPDLSYVENTALQIAAHLRPGQMVVLESTTYPGTTADVVRPILEKTGLKSGRDFFLAYSPEREDPGNRSFETSSIPKVVGGDGAQAQALAGAFYQIFINRVIPVSSLETAEAVKITENIFRAVNIAMINEMKVIYDKFGVDIWEVIEAAKTKPFGYMPFYPGPGLGGHCIPIDPFYLTWKAREYGLVTRFIELAGEINLAMPEYVLNKTMTALNERQGKSLRGRKVLVVGIAYKKNINDQRESPAFPLMRLFVQQGAVVEYHDPHIPEITSLRHFPELVGKKSVAWTKEKIAASDVAVIVTDHDDIPFADLGAWAPLIVDTRNAMKDLPQYAEKTVKA
jgi:UDP-N-acetyl-D-glucosamine dehydrogenase